MRNPLIAFCLLPTLALAQQLHTFKNGEVADADKLNESLQYILHNASGGCSATQQDNSVVIECADGTSGVIAGAGTTVLIQPGTAGDASLYSYDSGDLVVIDNSDVTLARVLAIRDGGYMVELLVHDSSSKPVAIIKNNDLTQETEFYPVSGVTAYFLEMDCQGPAFSNNSSVVYKHGDNFSIGGGQQAQTLLAKSRFAWQTGGIGGCSNQDYIGTLSPNSPYSPAPEILNAAYPVRLEQLP